MGRTDVDASAKSGKWVLFILPLIPMRLVALCVAWTPFLLLHPFSQTHLPLLLGPHLKKARLRVARLVDDDRLEDRHWRSELRDVELWENERYGEKEKGFSKSSLKSGERKPWTRGRDGWTEEGADRNGGVRSVTLLFFSMVSWNFALIGVQQQLDVHACTWLGVRRDRRLAQGP